MGSTKLLPRVTCLKSKRTLNNNLNSLQTAIYSFTIRFLSQSIVTHNLTHPYTFKTKIQEKKHNTIPRNHIANKMSEEQDADQEQEQSMDIYGSKKYYEDNKELKQEKEEIVKALLDNKLTPGLAKLQLWLYRTLRIVMTDDRVLIGVFLCTDADANVILGVCSEYAPYGGEERMLGLVMVPGKC